MVDDPNQRPYRPNDPYGRGGAPAPGRPAAGDPLAELARLIGQNDPFAEFGRDGSRRAAARDPRQEPRQAPSQAPGDPTLDWPAPAANRQSPAAAPDPRIPVHPHYDGLQPNHASPPAGSHPPPMPQTQPFNVPGFERQSYGEQRYDGGAELYRTGYEAQGDAPAPPDAPAPQDGHPRQADPYYHDNNAHMPAEGEDMYDDVPRPRRRGLLIVAAVISVAVIGTAGAFGYRAIFGTSASTPPPVIKAETAPSKVVSAGQGSEPQSNKLIYDRVGDRSGGERVVSREEQPVDMKDSKPPPRVVFPGMGAASSGSSQDAAPAPLPASSSSLASAEPKKIRTIVIKPDQPVISDPTANPRLAPPARSASAPPAIADSGQSAPAPAPRAAATRTAPAAAASNAPLSLSPDATPSTPAAPAMRTAAAPPRVAATPPTATTASAAPVAAGSYAVQLSSQRSEGEAQASFQALQGKYPNLLGGRQPMIRRADLGSKGTYYRAMVGPFATADQANELCSSLKTAGGQCIVQKN